MKRIDHITYVDFKETLCNLCETKLYGKPYYEVHLNIADTEETQTKYLCTQCVEMIKSLYGLKSTDYIPPPPNQYIDRLF